MKRLTVSGVGMAMMTVKQDEIAAESIGHSAGKIQTARLLFFPPASPVQSALFLQVIRTTISPGAFMYNDSVTVLAMVVLGGLGSIPGSIIGAAR